ncbi:MAG TPA: PfkB family carbohydrate kinase [Bacteroidales bacterium]|nr:PfkB family carbohydrate kinase [Bacteroidales bacterium]
MRKIFGIGETVLDVIFKEGQPQAAKAGGSVLNSVVSMGRMGLPVSFISEYGADDVGDIIDSFLNKNGVNTSSVHRYEDGKTTLALAFLNERNDAHYSFYKDYPSRRLNIEFPHLQQDDILQFGSFYAIWPEIRTQIRKFVQESHNSGALVVYDPNFRKSHLDELSALKPLIIENMRMASLVRASDEDFRNIFRVNSPDEAWEIVKNYCNCLVYTASTEGVYVRTRSFSGKFPVKSIIPVSTIGAGDNFNAGMITSIYRNGIGRDQLAMTGQKEWTSIIETAVNFATHVCLSYENYISEEFASQVYK